MRKISLLILIAASIFISGCQNSAQTQQACEKPLFSFGMVADIQHADREPVHKYNCFYRCSIPKLRECVNYFNSQDLAFAIQLGDFIDCKFESFDTVNAQWNKIKTKKYMVIGNHDYVNGKVDKSAVYEKMGLENPYYSFTQDGFRFIVLESYDVGVWATPEGCEKQLKAKKWLKKLKAEKAKNAVPWNSAISKEQLQWLDATLAQADKNGEKAIIFAHHPPMPIGGGGTLWNSEEVVKILEKHDSTQAYINGHLHSARHCERNGINYVSIESMLSKPEETGYAIVHMYPDHMVIDGCGRVTDYDLKFRTQPQN